jgi:hypothetical protein
VDQASEGRQGHRTEGYFLKVDIFNGDIMRIIAILSVVVLIFGFMNPDPEGKLFFIGIGTMFLSFSAPSWTIFNERLPVFRAWLIMILIFMICMGCDYYSCISADISYKGEYILKVFGSFFVGCIMLRLHNNWKEWKANRNQ